MEITTPSEFLALQKECICQVRYYVDLANRKLGLNLPYPQVRFNLRGTTAGKAWCGKNLIEFSPTLLRENAEDFLLSTTGHEVGHLVAHCRHHHSIEPHGKEWRNVMWTMGLPATRCHNYDTSNVPSQMGKGRNKIIRAATPLGQVTTTKFGRVISLD
jgi:SprT protein